MTDRMRHLPCGQAVNSTLIPAGGVLRFRILCGKEQITVI